MSRIYRLLAALVLTACGGQEIAQEAPEPTPAAEIISDEATADATSAPAEEESEETTDEAATEGFPLIITDGAGREVTFESPPEQIVCYYFYCFVTLIDLGLKPFAVPEWFEGNPPTSLQEIPDVMSGIELIPLEGDVPSPEVIISLEPDLVIVPEEFATPLEGIVPTFIPLPLNSLEALFENMPFYGQLLDREAEAEIAIKALQDRISAYQNTVPRNDLTVMNIISVDESDPSGGELFVRTLNSADCALLDLILECPYEDPVANGQAYSFSTNIEYVLEQDPDVLLVRFREIPLNEGRELLESDILWSELSAVQNDRLITGNVNLTASGFAEATFLLDNTIPRIFPDVFPNGPLTDEEVQEILAEQ